MSDLPKKIGTGGVWCPNCQAKPGDPCTQPTDNDRRPVPWYHHSRFNELTKWEESGEK